MRTRAVFADGRWDGKSLHEWVPQAVADIVSAYDPVRVVLFGSTARGDEGKDSDLDLLVVLGDLGPEHPTRLMGKIRGAIDVPAAINIFVTTPEDFERRKDVIGSVYYWASREGVVVYERGG